MKSLFVMKFVYGLRLDYHTTTVAISPIPSFIQSVPSVLTLYSTLFFLAAHRREQCHSDCVDYAEVPEGKMDVRLQIHTIFCFDLPRYRVHAVRELSDGERGRREREKDQGDATHGRHAGLRLLVSLRIDRVFSPICAFVFCEGAVNFRNFSTVL